MWAFIMRILGHRLMVCVKEPGPSYFYVTPAEAVRYRELGWQCVDVWVKP